MELVSIITRLISRNKSKLVQSLLEQFPAVALLGPRQVGKTTLAQHIATLGPSVYVDLEYPADREKLNDAALYLQHQDDQLVILDEVHRTPDLFQVLRSLIDQGRRKGIQTGRFLLLGSASIDLLKQAANRWQDASLMCTCSHLMCLKPITVCEKGSGFEAAFLIATLQPATK